MVERNLDIRLLDYELVNGAGETIPHLDQTTKELLLVERARREMAAILYDEPEAGEHIVIGYATPNGKRDTPMNTIWYVVNGQDLISEDEGFDRLSLLHFQGFGLMDVTVKLLPSAMMVTLELNRSFGLTIETIDAISYLRKMRI